MNTICTGAPDWLESLKVVWCIVFAFGIAFDRNSVGYASAGALDYSLHCPLISAPPSPTYIIYINCAETCYTEGNADIIKSAHWRLHLALL
jgi:hypothetical protein